MSGSGSASGKDVIGFDGECGLCNAFVAYVFRRDKAERFQFRGGNTSEWITLESGGVTYTKSDAVIRILGWKMLFLIPRFLRDWIYDLVARNRRRLFGAPSCPIGERIPAHRLV